MTEKATYKAQIRAYVETTDFVTFAELHKRLAGDAREETELALPGNRVVWAGLPRVMLDAILELLAEEALAAVPCHKSAYVRAGRVLKLPIERTVPPEGHAEPHWFTVLLRPMAAVLEEEAE